MEIDDASVEGDDASVEGDDARMEGEDRRVDGYGEKLARQGTTADAEAVATRVIGMAIEIHRDAGPGLYEHTYEDCLDLELKWAGLRFRRQVALHMLYKGVRLHRTYRADFIIEDAVILEIKSIDKILPIHESQILTYLRASGCHIGLILNFNTNLMKNGLRRFVL
jgi:GxxExxY protein